jgi:hypothetical protein
MKNIKPPFLETVDQSYYRVFLGGSIEMGKADEWQDRLANHFVGYPIAFYNPRREDWDPEWKQVPDHLEFNHQVTWELTNIDQANLCVFYFDGDTMSPVTMMELGYVGGKGINTMVYCPTKYFRYGNVKIFCDRMGISITSEYDKFFNALTKKLCIDLP